MFDASARNTKPTRLGGVGDLNGGADRSAAEIPSERDGTRTRDLSARVARTVLTDWSRGTEFLIVGPILPLLDRLLARHRCFAPQSGGIIARRTFSRAAVLPSNSLFPLMPTWIGQMNDRDADSACDL